ncbi:MAG: hypothetical protein LBT39_10440 [Treponema sp.]|jgi:hypothetical protein|nr:hypothetical protein [Treponema sp.]
MKKMAWFALFIVVAGLLAAQTAEEMDHILNTRALSSAQAAWFIMMAANKLPSGIDAFALARERHWLSPRARPDSPIQLGEASYLIMRSFDLKGGILYTLFPGPRYACRELVALQFIQGKTDPGSRLGGVEFLQLLGRVLTHTETNDTAGARRE